MKVLLFANDVMPFGQLPTSGGGLRCWQLMKGLQSQGIEVVASMPAFTYLLKQNWDKVPQEQRELLWEFHTQDEIFKRVAPDAVLYASNWDHFNLRSKPNVPLVIDLHGSRFIETRMWGAGASGDHKVNVLSKADCLLCAGQKQRLYFYGWLMQAGRVAEEEHFIRYIPISLSPDSPPHPGSAASDYPHLASGGGWFPWQNQSAAIFQVAKEVERRNQGKFSIYGGPHERLGNSPEENLVHDIYDRLKALAANSNRIDVGGYLSREQLLEVYSRTDVALELMNYNLERELAFTTRTIEYLWCGLPVIYNNYSEISDHIAEYDAGWTLAPGDETQLSQTLDEIFSNRELLAAKSANAQRLVRDRFSWDKTILPLVQFLQNPVVVSASNPALGDFRARPSFLSVQGEGGAVGIAIPGIEIEQELCLPAENLAGVEIPYAIQNPSTVSKAITELEVSLRKRNSKVISSATFKVSELSEKGRLKLKLPLLLPPAGGERLKLVIKVKGNTSAVGCDAADFELRCVRGVCYPLCAAVEVTGLSKPQQLQLSLALSFLPGEYSFVYQARRLAQRGWEMARQGQFDRLYRAVRWRLPHMVARAREAMAGVFGQ